MIHSGAHVPNVTQISPDTAEDRWHHVSEAIPRLSKDGVDDETENVLVWCRKRHSVFAGRLVIEFDGPLWHTRSLDGSVIADFHRHGRDVCHWRPIPREPELA
jgi:hypothetical protein